MVGLADCNNFFVSCERSIDRSLEGVPMVVLSNNDGCVIARSNEAKLMGIKMGQPAFQIRDLISSGKVLAYSGNHLLYREKSLRVHEIFKRFVPATIDYSVDESFLDVKGIPLEIIPEIGAAIVEACYEEEFLPVTLGFAPTKTLAKIATEVGKIKKEKVVLMPEVEQFYPIMEEMSIADLWGIGVRLAKRLYLDGVITVKNFYDKDLRWVRSKLGVQGERSWRELHGENSIELSHVGRGRQESISESRTFPTDIDDYDYIRSRIAIYCAHVSKRLRMMEGECGELTVFLSSNRFHLEQGYVAPECKVAFTPPTDDAALITAAAVDSLDRIFRQGQKYKRAGVVLSRIVPRRSYSPSLFVDIDQQRNDIEKSRKLMRAIDGLNVGEGEHVVKLASQLTCKIIGHNDGYSSSFQAPRKEQDKNFSPNAPQKERNIKKNS